MCLSRQMDKSFVATKMILVAAPTSDTAAGVVSACHVFVLWLGGAGGGGGGGGWQGMTIRTARLPGAGNLLGRAGKDLSGLPDILPILIKMVDFKNLAWAASFATRASRKFIYLPYRASGKKSYCHTLGVGVGGGLFEVFLLLLAS